MLRNGFRNKGKEMRIYADDINTDINADDINTRIPAHDGIMSL